MATAVANGRWLTANVCRLTANVDLLLVCLTQEFGKIMYLVKNYAKNTHDML